MLLARAMRVICGMLCGLAVFVTGDSAAQTRALIGVSLPLTNISANIGRSINDAVRMAADEANLRQITVNQQRIRFEVLTQDDRDDSNHALIVANYLNAAGVIGVIGNVSSSVSISTAATYAAAHIAQISPTATGLNFTRQGHRNAFRVIGNDFVGSNLLAPYAVNTLNAKRIAIVHNGSIFAASLADYLSVAIKHAGGSIVSTDIIASSTSDFNQVLMRIKNNGADLIFMAGYAEQAPAITSSMKRLGVKASIMFGLSGVAEPGFIQVANDTAEGALALETGVPPQRLAGWKTFHNAYLKRYGTEPHPFALSGYDAANLLIAAVQQADSLQREKIIESLHRIKFKGLTGSITFDEKGDLNNPTFTLYQVRNQEWVAIKLFGG